MLFSLVPTKDGNIIKFVYDQPSITVENINEWILNVLNSKRLLNWDNTIKYVKSEEIPANNNDENLIIVVGNTFEEIILNNEKDVLLEISSIWDEESKKVK